MGVFGNKDENQQPLTAITPEQLQQILEGVVSKMKEPTPLEKRKLAAEEEDDRRRMEMSLQLAKIEEDADKRKKNGCTHMRYAATAGKLSGHGAPKGSFNTEWTTGGQVLQDGTAVLICTRCSTTWRFRPSPDRYAYIMQEGMMGEAPPVESEVLVG